MKKIFKVLKKRRISYLKSVMRGYRYLLNKKEINPLYQFKRDLTNTRLELSVRRYDDFLYFGKDLNKSEKIFRQYLLNKFLNSYFNENILSYFGKKSFSFKYGYPIEWLLYLKSKEIKINFALSKIFWRLKIILNFCKSIKYFFNIIFNTYKNNLNKSILKKDSIYINSISEKLKNSSYKGFTCINWIKKYIQEKDKKMFSIILEPNSNLKYLKELEEKDIFFTNLFNSVDSFKSLMNLSAWYLKAILICIYDLIFRRGLRAYLLTESLKTKVYHLNLSSVKINYAFFNCSNWIYKPLWTYLSEKFETKVIFYFYSTNTFQMSKNNKEKFKDIVNYGWESNSWNNYYVWNSYQEKFISFLPNKSKIEIVGPILHEDSNNKDKSLLILKKYKTLCLFDITIFRDFYYQTEGLKYSYETPKNAIKFIEDVVELSSKKGIHVIFKSKRTFSKRIHPKYKLFLENFDNNNFHRIDPEISIHYILENTNGCISFPFTSTSVLAKSYKMPTCFYDPSGSLNIIKNQSHDIKLVRSKEELESWINNI